MRRTRTSSKISKFHSFRAAKSRRSSFKWTKANCLWSVSRFFRASVSCCFLRTPWRTISWSRASSNTTTMRGTSTPDYWNPRTSSPRPPSWSKTCRATVYSVTGAGFPAFCGRSDSGSRQTHPHLHPHPPPFPLKIIITVWAVWITGSKNNNCRISSNSTNKRTMTSCWSWSISKKLWRIWCSSSSSPQKSRN